MRRERERARAKVGNAEPFLPRKQVIGCASVRWRLALKRSWWGAEDTGARPLRVWSATCPHDLGRLSERATAEGGGGGGLEAEGLAGGEMVHLD